MGHEHTRKTGAGRGKRGRAVVSRLPSLYSIAEVGIVVEGFTVAHVHVHLTPLHHEDEIDPRSRRKGTGSDVERLSGGRNLTTACTRPRISILLIARLGAVGVECAAGDAGR